MSDYFITFFGWIILDSPNSIHDINQIWEKSSDYKNCETVNKKKKKHGFCLILLAQYYDEINKF